MWLAFARHMDEGQSATAFPAEPIDAPRRRRNWHGAAGMGIALVLAFVWGGIADREIGRGKSAARILPATVQGTVVAGAQAAPRWIEDFASAFCKGDAETIAHRIGAPLTNNVDAIANALSDRDWKCNDIRFAGGGANPKGAFYMYVTRDGQNGEQWWVFTVVGEQVVAID
jgi:hypothetical protein